MIRPPLEVADIIRTYGTAFVKRHRRWLTGLHFKVLRAIVSCRTAALGGHIEQCDSCGQRAISLYRLMDEMATFRQPRRGFVCQLTSHQTATACPFSPPISED